MIMVSMNGRLCGFSHPQLRVLSIYVKIVHRSSLQSLRNNKLVSSLPVNLVKAKEREINGEWFAYALSHSKTKSYK